MTKFQEFPLRPTGQAWPGLNSRGGRIDPGMGQLEDGSFNQIINESDLLEKRPGFTRGLEERFDGPVCGLFRYTDDCGVEYLLVADQTEISIRTPFILPVNANSDAYPVDSFDDDLDTDNWQNTADYETAASQLELVAGAAAAATVEQSRLMAWFKDASNFTYFVQIEYVFDLSGGSAQSAAVAVRRSTDDYVQAEVRWDGTNYSVHMLLFINGSSSSLFSSPLDGVALGTGFLRLTYKEDRKPTVRVTPSGGSIVEQEVQITSVQEAALGLGSSIGLAGLVETPAIKQVNASPV